MLEKDDILQAIRDTGATVGEHKITGGDITKAARKLGVSRRTLQARMRHYGIPTGKAGRRKKTIKYHRAIRRYGGAVAAVAVVVGAAAIYNKNA